MRVIGIINLELSSGRFPHREGAERVLLFDPFQLQSSYAVMNSSVKNTIESLIGLNDGLQYVEIVTCTQKIIILVVYGVLPYWSSSSQLLIGMTPCISWCLI